jgi:hypothetical protein
MDWAVSGVVCRKLDNIHPPVLTFYYIITFFNNFNSVIYLFKCLRKRGIPGK